VSVADLPSEPYLKPTKSFRRLQGAYKVGILAGLEARPGPPAERPERRRLFAGRSR